MWEPLANGSIHASLEFWTSSPHEYYRDYVVKRQEVLNGGPLGVVGQAGWYVPSYVLDVYPGVFWGNFNETIAAYFNNTYYTPYLQWSVSDLKIIETMGYNLSVVELGGEENHIARIREAHNKREPLLFYFWSPHPLAQELQLFRLGFPLMNFYHRADILSKLYWAGLNEYSTASVYFLQSFTLTTDITTALLNQSFSGDPVFDVACNWVKQNEATWSLWILPVNFRIIDEATTTAMYTLTAISLALAVFYLIIVTVKRNTKVMIAASRTFLITMCVGGMLMYGSVIAFSTLSDYGCTIFVWTLATGFGTLFGSLFAKNGRIYLVLSNRSLKIVKYTDKDVGLVVFMILIGEWVMLIIGQVMDPPSYDYIANGTIEYNFCSFHYGIGVALLVYNAALVIVGIVLSVLISYVKLTLYAEAKYIGFAMYNFGLASAFVLAIIFVEDPMAKFVVVCIGILFLTNIALGLIFVPKIYLTLKYTDEQLRLRNDLEINRAIHHKARSRKGSAKPKVQQDGQEPQQESSIRVSSYEPNNTSYMSSGLSSIDGELGKLISNTRKLHEENEQLKQQNEELQRENEELKRRLIAPNEDDSFSESDPI
jgi:glycine betaine/proline transport system substrate-binding protein